MPKSETSNSNSGPSFQAPRYKPNWLVAAICFVLGPSLTVALIDYAPNQVTLNSTHATATNIVGTFGANTVWCMLWIFGVSVVLVPIFLFWMLYVSIRNPRRLTASRSGAMLVCIIALASLAAMIEFRDNAWFPQGLGGLAGVLLYKRALSDTIGLFGSGLLLGTVYVCGLVFIFTKDLGAELERYLAAFHAWRDARAKRRAELAELAAKAKAEQAKAAKTGLAPAAPAPSSAGAPAAIGPSAKKFVVPKSDDPLAKPALAPAAAATLEPPPQKAESKPASLRLPARTAEASADRAAALTPAGGKLELNIVKPEENKKSKAASVTIRSDDRTTNIRR